MTSKICTQSITWGFAKSNIFALFFPLSGLSTDWTIPIGILGRINNTSLFTSSVTLLTSPESKVGVWVDRIQINGLLVGLGNDYPSLILYSKDADIKVGDFVSSSPASTLLPPNIPIGVVQSIDEQLKAEKTVKISLFAKPNVIDWVQILNVKI